MKREVHTAMKINTITYLIGDAFKSLKRNKTISIASVITVFITFIVLGVFTLVAENANLAIAGVEDKIEIQVFLNKDIKLIDQREIQVKLNEQDGVQEVTYESQEQAYNNFKETTSEGMLKGYTLENNPFPASYIVKISDVDKISNIIEQVEGLEGVESIENQQELINTMSGVVRGVRLVGVILFAILVAVSIFLIMNTTKLTVYSRRKEVGIMKFVGATDWFIRWPFIIEGMVIGCIGALLSIIAIFGVYKWIIGIIVSKLLVVHLVSISYVYTTMLWEFALGGIIIGGIASYGALRKFLTV